MLLSTTSEQNVWRKKMTSTVSIKFSTDKAGRPRAHYWGLARRWLPISIAKAEFWIATGKAVING
jgi:hypothetical protein